MRSVPFRTTIEDHFEIEVFGRDEVAPGSLSAWLEQHDDPRIFAAVVNQPLLGRVQALAVWPSDIPPPELSDDDFPAALRRDAVQFVQPGVSTCGACDANVEGLFVLGRLWFGGNRRRHKMDRCPKCDADYVHSGLALLRR